MAIAISPPVIARPHGASILVVDDTVENLHVLAGLLSDSGYEVRPVVNGQAALAAATSSPPELVLLDVAMPEMDGYEVCRRLKAVPALREVPVIFITALTETSDKVKGFEAGGADYITKPFQIDEVLARVKVHVALRQSRAELAESYARLRSLEETRDELVHMVVHDMRSPLAALVMLLQGIQEDAGSAFSGQIAEGLRMAIGAAGAVNRMATDILDMSRLEEENLPLERRPTDIIAMCNEVVAMYRGLDRSRAISFPDAGPLEADCDRRVIARVIENIVGNALKHTPTGGRIQITARKTARAVRISVRDEGPGVPPEVRAKIFDKFGALEARRSRRFESSGLGLAFCKLAVEAHGGEIGVESAEPSGSTFWFELPL